VVFYRLRCRSLRSLKTSGKPAFFNSRKRLTNACGYCNFECLISFVSILPIDFFPQIGYNMANLELNSRLVAFCLVKYELY